MKRFTRDEIARRVARDIPEGAYVNLGIGLPTMVANHLDKSREIFLHSENGLLGMGPFPTEETIDADMIVPVKIIKIDRENGKTSLSIKEADKDFFKKV